MDVLPIWSRRSYIIGAVGLILVVLLMAGIVVARQQQLAAQASAPAGVCAPNGSATVVDIITPLPPGVTLPVTLPVGEPRVVATVNGDPLYAEALEMRVEATLANNRQQLQEAEKEPRGSLPPNVLASLKQTSNQVRHDALTRMIQDCLLLQEGKRLGLTASLPPRRRWRASNCSSSSRCRLPTRRESGSRPTYR